MRKSSLVKFIALFVAIWSTWSIWDVLQPFIDIDQLAALFLFLPISALLVGISFLIDDEDDDDLGGGLMEPIWIRSKS